MAVLLPPQQFPLELLLLALMFRQQVEAMELQLLQVMLAALESVETSITQEVKEE